MKKHYILVLIAVLIGCEITNLPDREEGTILIPVTIGGGPFGDTDATDAALPEEGRFGSRVGWTVETNGYPEIRSLLVAPVWITHRLGNSFQPYEEAGQVTDERRRQILVNLQRAPSLVQVHGLPGENRFTIKIEDYMRQNSWQVIGIGLTKVVPDGAVVDEDTAMLDPGEIESFVETVEPEEAIWFAFDPVFWNDYYNRRRSGTVHVTLEPACATSTPLEICGGDLPPPNPLGVDADPGTGEGEIDLNWTNQRLFGEGDFSFTRITWSPSGEGHGVQPVDVPGITGEAGSRTINGLISGVQYTFRLTTVDTNGNSSTGVEIRAAAANFDPNSVEHQSATGGANEGEVDLSWTNPSDADFSRVAISANPAEGSLSSEQMVSGTPGSGGSLTVTGLTPGTLYTFTMIAIDNGGNRAGGVDVIHTAPNLAPAAVSEVSAVDGMAVGEVDLSWTNPSDADFSRVAISANPAEGSLSSEQMVSGAPGSMGLLTVTGLTPGTLYTFRVFAIDNDGNRAAGIGIGLTL